MKDIQSIISEALANRKDGIFRAVSTALHEAFPEKALLETEDGMFNVHEFGFDGQWSKGWDDFHERMYRTPYAVWHQIKWEDQHFQVLEIGIYGTYCREIRKFLIADNDESASRFFAAVCKWCSEIRGEILMFEEGHWSKSRDLYESVRKASLKNLVLRPGLKEEIIQDFRTFFDNQATYAKYGIPWKRGVLFCGPPGNGKTMTIKGVVNALDKPCLYVRSFKSEYGSDQANISKAFQRSRASAPCILILEDLDSLIDDGNRSFFLNELDGFSANEGFLTIGTTNHPERLDPAILDRPSRFDRKYAFDLPEQQERAIFLTLFASGLEPALSLSEESAHSVAALTEGFSFAYLKELYLSTIMQWINTPGQVDQIMSSLVETLRMQMSSEPEPTDNLSQSDAERYAHLPPAMKAFALRRRRR